MNAVWTGALFVSALFSEEPSMTGKVQQAVNDAIRRFGGSGCAERVAQEFGDHPKIAAARMRWARRLVNETVSNERHLGFLCSGEVWRDDQVEVRPAD